MKWTRRNFLQTGAALFVAPRLAGCKSNPLIERAIPATGESVPVIGIGTRNYRVGPSAQERAIYLDTLRTFAEHGGRVLDTAPSYGNSEEVVGALISQLGIRDQLFLATKVDVEGQAEGVDRMNRSFSLLGTDRIDLMQVHNLRDTATQLNTMRVWKAEGRIGLTGITTSSARQYTEFESVMRSEPLDFIQVDYSLGDRDSADRILPLAADRGLAVLINMPYGRGRVFARVGDRPLPDWAAEFDAKSWGQVFLKYVVSHPAVTAAIPGTTKPHHAADNMAAATGRLPDAAMRRQIEQFYDALPE